MKRPSKFDIYFEKVLREQMTAGSTGMGATGTQFPGDTYAPGDGRMMPHFLPNKKLKEDNKKKKETKVRKCPQGFMGSSSQPHSTKKGKKGYNRREKHQKKLTDSKIPMIRRSKIAM
jgi:hypothetical protein